MLTGSLLSKPRRDPCPCQGAPLPPTPLTAASPSSQTKFLLLPPGWSCLPFPGPEEGPCQCQANASGDQDAPWCVPRFPARGGHTAAPGDHSSPSTRGPVLPASPGSPSKPFLRYEELAKATGTAGNRLYSRREKGDGGTPPPPPCPQTLLRILVRKNIPLTLMAVGPPYPGTPHLIRTGSSAGTCQPPELGGCWMP